MEYYQAQKVEEALNLAAQEELTFWAGGTDLMVKYRGRLEELVKVVDIKGIEELIGIEKKQGKINLGPATTIQQLADSQLLSIELPALVKAAKDLGSPQIRHQGTIGGNIANASPAADLVPVLIAAAANLELSSADAKRIVPLEEIFLGPGETSVTNQELITNISIPLLSEQETISFFKIGRRKALAIAVLNGALYLQIDAEQRRFTKVRLCLGAVAPTPYRARKAEAELRGQEISAENISSAAEFAAQEVSPIDDLRGTASYRREVVKVAVTRLIESALGRWGGII